MSTPSVKPGSETEAGLFFLLSLFLVASVSASLLVEILSSDSKEVVSSLGKIIAVYEMPASPLTQSASSLNFITQDSTSGEMMIGLSVLEPSISWP